MGNWRQLAIDGREVEIVAEQTTTVEETFTKALRAVANDATPGDVEIKRVDIKILQTGEVVYRLTDREGNDEIGGVVSI